MGQSAFRTRAEMAAFVQHEVRAYLNDTDRSQPFRRWATVYEWPSGRADRTIHYVGELVAGSTPPAYSYRIALRACSYTLPLGRVKDWPRGVAGRRVMARELAYRAVHAAERLIAHVTVREPLEGNGLACDGLPLFCAERGNLLTGEMDRDGLGAATTAGDPLLNPSRVPLCYPPGCLLVPPALEFAAAHLYAQSWLVGATLSGAALRAAPEPWPAPPIPIQSGRDLRDPRAYYLLPERQAAPVAVVVPPDPALNARVAVAGRSLRVAFDLGAAVANPWGACKVLLPPANAAERSA